MITMIQNSSLMLYLILQEFCAFVKPAHSLFTRSESVGFQNGHKDEILMLLIHAFS